MKHPGSVESFLTIVPQLFIFLIMFQLIFMQFNSVKEMHLSQGALARVAILGDENDFIRYPLIGGGSVLLRENIVNSPKFIDFNSLALRKSIAIAVDENVRD